MKSKKILLAVTGSIAAYKSAYLVREFVKRGATVKVIMTEAAKAFISPLTLSTLSKNKVMSNVIDADEWNNHVDLGLWADCLIIAPATANTLAKMAHGICDNMVMATYLSAKCPVYFAPAMDRDMWLHPSTKNNLALLESFGNKIIPPEDGELASGLMGVGRMAEPQSIADFISNTLMKNQDLQGKHVLITAGPTYEDLDPVRYLGNRSSGKMGVSLAEECANRGASVTLVLGPSQLITQHVNINTINVRSAQDMYNACQAHHANSDICIFAAAVADYRPDQISDQKIKKSDNDLSLNLVRNIDIAKTLGASKIQKQIHIGFALETHNEAENAKRKLEKKNFDMIVLNSLNDRGAGFQFDTNKINIYTRDNQHFSFELKSKTEVATDIIDTLVHQYLK